MDDDDDDNDNFTYAILLLLWRGRRFDLAEKLKR